MIAHLIEKFIGLGLARVVLRAVRDLRGSSAFVAMSVDEPDVPAVAKSGSPLLVGIGDGECFIASDQTALCRHTSRFIAMDDGDIAAVGSGSVDLLNFYGRKVNREVLTSTIPCSPSAADAVPRHIGRRSETCMFPCQGAAICRACRLDAVKTAETVK